MHDVDEATRAGHAPQPRATGFYGPDLSYVHHTGFGAFAVDAAPGLLALLEGAGVRGGLVVDLGCGSGLWARALLEAGYDVLGVDVSPAMIDLATSVAPGARFLRSSAYEVEIPPCAAVTAVGEGLGYIAAEDPRTALPELFSRVHGALAPGGVFVFDMVLRSADRPMRYHSLREGPDWRVEVDVREDPEASLLERRIVTVRHLAGGSRRVEEMHRVRTFSRAELERALRACGFSVRVSRRYGDFPLPPRRLAFRARKRVRTRAREGPRVDAPPGGLLAPTRRAVRGLSSR